MMTFDPISEICAWMLRLEPCPIASIVITEDTPIIMPSIVKKQRNLLFFNERKAICIKLPQFIVKWF